MTKYRKIGVIITLIILFLVVSLILVYQSFLRPVSHDKTLKEIVIPAKTTSKGISKILITNKVIKNDKFFVLYLKINHINDLKAGTYQLSESMSLKEIVKLLQKGNSYNDQTIKITFKEGINFRELARVIEASTNNTYEDVLNFGSLENKDYLNSLIEDYWFVTDSILNPDIYYPLEGYLYPDTYYFRSKDVTVAEIFNKLLDQMQVVLDPFKENILNSNYSIHELLTLASIAEKEASIPTDRSKVVSVFINRLNKNMSLGSDITARYGIKLDDTRALTKSEYNNNNPYNTRLITKLGLPVGPISMVEKSSIEASIKPETTNYLYFIANIQTKETFFFENSKDFENKKNELKKVNGGY